MRRKRGQQWPYRRARARSLGGDHEGSDVEPAHSDSLTNSTSPTSGLSNLVRTYDAPLGSKDHYPPDREAAAGISQSWVAAGASLVHPLTPLAPARVSMHASAPAGLHHSRAARAGLLLPLAAPSASAARPDPL